MNPDPKSALNVSYVIIMFLTGMMAIDYLGVVAPSLLGKNFILDMLAPLAFQYATPLRWCFIVASVITFLVSPAGDMMGDTIARNQKRKTLLIITFTLSTLFIALLHHVTYVLFAVFYPFVFLLFNISGFILANLLKTKEVLLEKMFGFERIDVLVENPYSFNWRGEDGQYLNVENSHRGCLILGGAGSGKTFTIIETILDTSVHKATCGLVYDVKMNANFSKQESEWSLTRYAYKCFMHYHSKPARRDADGKWIGEHSIDNDRRRLWIVNFRDVRYSHRVNPIHPDYMTTQAFANESSLTLMQNLKPEWIRQRDFFADSAIIYLKAIFWFLRSQFPESCTIPHAVTIALMPHSKVLAMLNLDKQCSEIISSLVVAEQKNAEGQIAGAVASLQVPIDKINSPEIFWVLSGNDFSLRLNDPEDPGLLCLGNDLELRETYGPVAALIATVAKKMMNRPGMLPSIFLLEEAPSIVIPNLSELPSTARSNLISCIVCGQDKSLFIEKYGKEQTDSLFANLGNHFYGQLNDLDTAKMASEIIGNREKENRSVNQGKTMGEQLSKNTGETIGIQRENLIHPYELLTLQQGRFVGKVAQVSTTTPYSPFFNIRPKVEKIKLDHEFPMLLHLESERVITEERMNDLMSRNYDAIKKEAFKLVDHCAKAACLGGKADETKVFPQHFYKGKRIVSTLGEPMVDGIEVDPETGSVSGTPRMDDGQPT